MSSKPHTAVVLLTGQHLSTTLADLYDTLTYLIPRTRERLIIWIQSPELSNDSPAGLDWHAVHQLLTNVYLQATAITHRLDKLLFNVDVVLRRASTWFQLPPTLHVDALYWKQPGRTLEEHNPRLRLRTSNAFISQRSADTFGSAINNFPVVVLGGTFDHLHAGHKILLTMAAFLATEKLIVGITDDALLTKKAYAEVLEPLPERIAKTRAFLTLIKPGIKYDLVPINDVYGPTGWDPDIQALVVSKETLSGGKAIARHRQEHNLPALEEFVVDIIAPDGSNLGDDVDLKELKISSTAIRKYLMSRKRTNSTRSRKISSRY